MKKAKLLFAALASFAFAAFATAQNVDVYGVVSDSETGEPIMGAIVQLQGDSQQYSMTDLNGNYSLSAVPSDGVLSVSILGYESMDVRVAGRTRVDIVLEPDVEMLTDAIVLGYGSAKKISSITGSATTVNAKVLQNAPTANVGDALQGQIAGLQVWSNSGEPSETVSMRIRGVNSINAGTEPLYVLDGSPVPATIFNVLSSNDIENITVMKDASATSIYGSRAANGVVFITTKQGYRAEKPTLVVRGQYGVSQTVRHQIPLMTSEQWFDFNTMIDPSFMTAERQAQKDFALKYNINTDWFDYFFQDNAPTWQADIAYSGGTETTDYYVSVGALRQEGNAPNSDMSRVSMLSKLNTQVTDWFKAGFSLNLSYQDVNATGFGTSSERNSVYNPMFMSSQMLPWVLPYEYTENPDGTLTLGEDRTYFDEMNMYNTLYLQELQPRTETYARISGNIYEQLTPVKGLILKAVQALNGYDLRYSAKASPEGPFDGAGIAAEQFGRYYQITLTNTAEYTVDFLENHNLTFLLGQEAIMNRSEGFAVDVEGITDPRLPEISDGTQTNSPSRSQSDETFNSFFARVSYNYKDTYLLDASFRRDGSSLFGRNKRWANFWSIGGRWNLMNEEFLSDVDWINTLSLKASYGTTGNSSIGNYLAFGVVGSYSQPYDGNPAWGLGQSGNDDLTWEVVESLNLGVSARFFGSLGVDVDFYNKVTSDMLMEIPYSLTTGQSGGWGNIASMLNRGVDFELSFDVPMPRDFYLNISANFNYNYNEILSLFDGRDYFEYPGTGLRLEVGKPYGEFYYPLSAGVDPRDGMQMWYDQDGNKTKVFSDDYAQFTGKQQFAPWAGGFNFTFAWKSLSVGAQFSWVADKWTINNDRYFLTNPTFATSSNMAAELLNAWTTPGQITNVPSVESPRHFDDTLLEDSSFMRLKNLQISYTLPNEWMQRTGFLGSVRVFAIGRNLLTFTKYTGFDPEYEGNLQLGRYPNSKQYTFGVEITF